MRSVKWCLKTRFSSRDLQPWLTGWSLNSGQTQQLSAWTCLLMSTSTSRVTQQIWAGRERNGNVLGDDSQRWNPGWPGRSWSQRWVWAAAGWLGTKQEWPWNVIRLKIFLKKIIIKTDFCPGSFTERRLGAIRKQERNRAAVGDENALDGCDEEH